MKYIVDASVLIVVGRGDWLKIEMLGWRRKRDVAVPEPVVAHTALEVPAISKPEAMRRWTMLVDAMPRAAWTSNVTTKLLELAPRDNLATDLDAITVAHALAYDATVLTIDRERYAWISSLRVEEL